MNEENKVNSLEDVLNKILAGTGLNVKTLRDAGKKRENPTNKESRLGYVDWPNDPRLDHDGEKRIRETLFAEGKDSLDPFDKRVAEEVTIPIAGLLELSAKDGFLKADVAHAVMYGITMAFAQFLERNAKEEYLPLMVDHLTHKFHDQLEACIGHCIYSRMRQNEENERRKGEEGESK